MTETSQPTLRSYEGTLPYVFVSYAHADSAVVLPQMQMLNANGINQWYDEGIHASSLWRDEIAKALAACNAMLFFVTPNSVASRHCTQEMSFCHSRGIPILAVHLEDCPLPVGVELTLGDQQAILRYELSREDYQRKLVGACKLLLSANSDERRQPSSGATAIPAAQSARSELKQITVVHCKLALVSIDEEPPDPENYGQALAYCKRAVTDQMSEAGAVVSDPGTGDLLGYFGAAHAREGDTERAAKSALQLVESLPEMVGDTTDALELTARLKIGVQTGRALINADGEGPLATGQCISEAEALAHTARNTQVLIGAGTYALVRDFLVCEPASSVNTNGVDQPSFAVVGLRDTASNRLLVSLVGRDHELSTIHTAWQQAQQGQGGVVLLSGAPGIGKSGLTNAVSSQLEQDHVTVLRGECTPQHNYTALHPVAEMFLDASGIRPDWDEPRKRAALSDFLTPFNLESAAVTHLLSGFCGLDPTTEDADWVMNERERILLLEALIDIVLQMSEQRPVLLVIEDLHWADDSTIELLGMMFEVLPDTNILCLLNFRPEFVPPWAVVPNVAVVTLTGISNDNALAMVRRELGDDALSAEAVADIVARADGVPLFLREVCKSVIDTDALVQVKSGRSAQLKIPATLRESLTARLDLLGETKRLAQIASVIGREFDLKLCLHAQTETSEAANTRLSELVRLGFLSRRGVGSRTRYQFQHALIRDVAYDSLVKKDRRELHKKVADSLLELFPERAASQPQIVAMHLREAGDIAEAAPWWIQAGDAAAKQLATHEAAYNFEQALDCVVAKRAQEHDIAAELEILMRLVPTYVANYGYAAEQLESICRRSLEICEELGDSPQTAFVLFALWMFLVVRADHQQSLALAERLASIVGEDPQLKVETELSLGIANFFVGRFEQAHTHLTGTCSEYDETLHGDHAYQFGQDPRVIAHSYLSWLYWLQGDSDRAVAAAEAARACAQSISHPQSQAFALSYSGFLAIYMGELDRAKNFGEELLALCEHHRNVVFAAHARVMLGWQAVASFPAGQPPSDQALAQLDDAINSFRSTGSRCFLPLWDAAYADALVRSGKVDAAQQVFESAQKELQNTGEFWAAAALLGVGSTIAGLRGEPDHAAELRREAEEYAETGLRIEWQIVLQCAKPNVNLS